MQTNKKPDSKKAFQTASDLLLEIPIYKLSTPLNYIMNEYDIRLYPYSVVENFLNCKSKIRQSVGFLTEYMGHYSILYDDRDDIDRIRWTWAHELGHYFLKHDFDKYDEYDTQETETNYFASQLLMPLELLLMLDRYYILTEQVLTKVCNTSLKSAKYRMNYYKKYRHTFASFNLNTDLMETYHKHIISSVDNDLKEFKPLLRSNFIV